MKTPGSFTEKFNGTLNEPTTSIFLGSMPKKPRDGKTPRMLARKGKNDAKAQNTDALKTQTPAPAPAGLETLLNTETLTLLTEDPPLPDEASREAAPMRIPAYDALIQQIQRALLALGFDMGCHGDDGLNGVWTGHAMREYEMFYGAPDPASKASSVLAQIENTAKQTVAESAVFGTASEVVAALRLAARATGVKFGYLMELADFKSGFDPSYREGGRAGLFGWDDGAWLDMIARFGERYGLPMYASQIERATDEAGNETCKIANPIVMRQVLALRLNPRLSALMAAEEAAENIMKLTIDTENRLSRAEMALAHLFGLEESMRFLDTMRKKPYQTAETLFEEQAARFPTLFNTPGGQPLPMAQVFGEVSELFSTGRFELEDVDQHEDADMIPA